MCLLKKVWYFSIRKYWESTQIEYSTTFYFLTLVQNYFLSKEMRCWRVTQNMGFVFVFEQNRLKARDNVTQITQGIEYCRHNLENSMTVLV